jgi:hypothetical protein
MLRKSVRELNFVRSKDPLPTIEIQADSVDEQGLNFGEVVSEALSNFAKHNQSGVATIYSYGTMSSNFHEDSWSEFLIVAGSAKVLKALGAAFAHHPNVKSRYSDYISPSDGRATYHLEGGRLWEVEDAITWYSADTAVKQAECEPESSSVENDFEDGLSATRAIYEHAEEVDDSDDAEDEDDFSSFGTATVTRKGRLNAARADAKVSTIRRNIEKVFGLPEGSVALCGPDKSPLKGNALIKTLRRRWEES